MVSKCPLDIWPDQTKIAPLRIFALPYTNKHTQMANLEQKPPGWNWLEAQWALVVLTFSETI